MFEKFLVLAYILHFYLSYWLYISEDILREVGGNYSTQRVKRYITANNRR